MVRNSREFYYGSDVLDNPGRYFHFLEIFVQKKINENAVFTKQGQFHDFVIELANCIIMFSIVLIFFALKYVPAPNYIESNIFFLILNKTKIRSNCSHIKQMGCIIFISRNPDLQLNFVVSYFNRMKYKYHRSFIFFKL